MIIEETKTIRTERSDFKRGHDSLTLHINRSELGTIRRGLTMIENLGAEQNSTVDEAIKLRSTIDKHCNVATI